MQRPSLRDAMLQSIRDLTLVRPHLHRTAHFGTKELAAYTKGFYWGVVMALEVAEAAAARYARQTKWLRAITRTKKSA